MAVAAASFLNAVRDTIRVQRVPRLLLSVLATADAASRRAGPQVTNHARGTPASTQPHTLVLQSIHRRACVSFILQRGLCDPPGPAGCCRPVEWQRWQSVVASALHSLIRSAQGGLEATASGGGDGDGDDAASSAVGDGDGDAGTDSNSVSGTQSTGGSDGDGSGSFVGSESGVHAHLRWQGLVCALDTLGYCTTHAARCQKPSLTPLATTRYLLPIIGDSLSADSVSDSLRRCLGHSAHAVRVAAVACLRTLAMLQPAVLVSSLNACLGTLLHTHAGVTSDTGVAATAAAAATAVAMVRMGDNRKRRQSTCKPCSIAVAVVVEPAGPLTVR